MNSANKHFSEHPISFVLCPPSPEPMVLRKGTALRESYNLKKIVQREPTNHAETETVSGHDDSSECPISCVVCPPSPELTHSIVNTPSAMRRPFRAVSNDIQSGQPNMERRSSVISLDTNAAKKIAAMWEVKSSNLPSSIKLDSLNNTPYTKRKATTLHIQNSMDKLGEHTSMSRKNALRSSFRGIHLLSIFQ